MLNSLTYGWWEGGTLYALNDGDHAVLYQARGRPATTADEGLSRLNATVAAGSLVLDSDDLTDPPAQARVRALLGRRRVMALASAGKPFRPVEGDTDWRAADVFVRDDHTLGRLYLAAFNYSLSATATRHLDLSRLGLSPSEVYSVSDLLSGRAGQARGRLSLTLPAAGSVLLCLRRSDCATTSILESVPRPQFSRT